MKSYVFHHTLKLECSENNASAAIVISVIFPTPRRMQYCSAPLNRKELWSWFEYFRDLETAKDETRFVTEGLENYLLRYKGLAA
jgi:hypothetical protein